jgi:hypothetical protein
VGVVGRGQAESGSGSPRIDLHAESGWRQHRQDLAAATAGSGRLEPGSGEVAARRDKGARR